MKRVPFSRMHEVLSQVLVSRGFSEERAQLSARLFTEASRDGVYSHGLNRFPRFIQYIQKGYVNVQASPKIKNQMGVMEQWDGQLGPGNLNAYAAMGRAIELAKEQGLGLIALGNTNHWMRGGTYGWQAADAGMIGICFTNTQPNMPPWGAKEAVLGNNPLIMALPGPTAPIVLDTAMTQFAFGKIELYRRLGKMLPVAGGYDTQGNITQDPAEIEASRRALPFGFWKGSGLSLMLDLIASTLSGGMSTFQIGVQGADEYGLSQFFLAINPHVWGQESHWETVVSQTLDAIHAAEPVEAGTPASYPGERTLKTRKENMELGIPVDEKYWEEILAM